VLLSFEMQEEQQQQVELKRQRDEAAVKEYRKKLRFSVSSVVSIISKTTSKCLSLSSKFLKRLWDTLEQPQQQLCPHRVH
jgi:hypothetical protein